jgi:hypothetical protein
MEQKTKPRRRTSTSATSRNENSLHVAEESITVAVKPVTPLNSNAAQQRWSQVSVFAFALSLVLFAIYATRSQSRELRSGVSDFLTAPSSGLAVEPPLGIFLHPEDHRSRDPVTLRLHWTITSGFRAPDGVKKKVYLINGNSVLHVYR